VLAKRHLDRLGPRLVADGFAGASQPQFQRFSRFGRIASTTQYETAASEARAEAARVLGVVPSTVSKKISALEEELGVEEREEPVPE